MHLKPTASGCHGGRLEAVKVHIEGQDEVEDVEESALEPSGRRVQLYGERMSISVDGVVVGPSGT